MTPDEHNRHLDEAEAAIALAARRAFAAWLPAVLAAVIHDGIIDPAAADQTREKWNEQVEQIVAAALAVFLIRFGAERGVGVRGPETFLGQVRSRLQRVRAQVFKKIDQVYRDGRASNHGPAEIRYSIIDALDSREWDAKALEIGRTEGITAWNTGAQLAWMSVPPPGEPPAPGNPAVDGRNKLWMSLRDSAVRHTHAEADGQVVPLASKFTVGGFEADYPGDPELPAHEACGCRCVVMLVTDSPFIASGAPMTYLEALVAAAGALSAETLAEQGLPNGWRGAMAALDVPTGDERILATPQGGVRTRTLPMSFRWAPAALGGHEGAVMAGRIDRVWVQDGLLMGEGCLDVGGADGSEFARQLGSGFAFGVSVDPDQITFEQKFYAADGTEVPVAEAIQRGDATTPDALKDGYKAFAVMVDWRLAAVTAVSIPALDEARVEPVWGYVPTGVNHPDAADGSMLALHPLDQASLALEGGLAPEDLHVTLAYLGKAADLSDGAAGAARRAAMDAADKMKNRTVRVAGYGTLGDKGAAVLFLNGSGIAQAHREVMSHLKSFGLESFKAQHEPFIPHLTLGYGIDPQVGASYIGREFEIGSVAHHHGPDVHTFAVQNDGREATDHALVAAVTGNTSYPVYPDRKHKWDGHKARQRVMAWASSDGSGDLEKIDFTKASTCFLYRGAPQTGNSLEGAEFADAAKLPRVEDFKLGIADIFDGSPKIVANAVIGLAGGHGINGTNLPAADKKAALAKLRTLYGKCASVFPDFPAYPFDSKAELIAAAVGGQIFTTEFFQDPQLVEPTPLRVQDDGRVLGHIAQWNSCYMAAGGSKVCLNPPKTGDYSRFLCHAAKLTDGSVIDVGALTFGEGHQAHGGLKASMAAYANVATIAAKGVVGEDEFGVWFSGEVVDAFRDHAYDLLLSPPSGHWEPDMDVGGALRMIAAHVVVTPGFHTRSLVASYDADGAVEALEISGPQGFLDTSSALFDEAVAAGRVTEAGVRFDGVVLFERAEPNLELSRAFAALEKMGLGPNARSKRALARIVAD